MDIRNISHADLLVYDLDLANSSPFLCHESAIAFLMPRPLVRVDIDEKKRKSAVIRFEMTADFGILFFSRQRCTALCGPVVF